MYLLDTNILSELVKRSPDKHVVDALFARQPADLFASEVTRYELRFGAASRADDGAIWKAVQAKAFPVVGQWLPVTQAISERAGDVRAQLRSEGRDAGALDPLLAATALVHDLAIVTRNTRDFDRITGLRVANWFGAS